MFAAVASVQRARAVSEPVLVAYYTLVEVFGRIVELKTTAETR
jgi:hypothetical protein